MNTLNTNYAPERSSIWKGNHVTYRRLWLDSCLQTSSDEIHGFVIDLGGKRENKRGSFQPPVHQADAWWYVNLDLETAPDIFADVTEVPLISRQVDYIICTEVLEHLARPQACVDEMHRLLRDDGVVFASVPFFYPVHADPYDYQRFTEDGLRHLFKNFKSVEIHPMGGYAGVLGLMVELGMAGVEGNSFFDKFLRRAMKWISRWLCWYDLGSFAGERLPWRKFTTGYFLRALK